MNFHEKLRRRVEDLSLNKAKAARDVGLPESTISNYLVREDSLPRIDIALKIAKAIRVPLEWLADDALPWPPPELDAKVGIQKLPAYTVYGKPGHSTGPGGMTRLPSASENVHQLAIVIDENGHSHLAMSDGMHWRIAKDDSIIKSKDN